jgi:hypothetical protein
MRRAERNWIPILSSRDLQVACCWTPITFRISGAQGIFDNQQRVRVGFMEVFDYIIASLLPCTRYRGFCIAEYDICGVVTETGFHDFQVS